MKRIAILALLSLALTACISEAQAQAQAVSIWDPVRLSVGARAYRSFVEDATAGQYTSSWWGGFSGAWELTSPRDPSVRFPVSAIAALDLGMPGKLGRGYAGGLALLNPGGDVKFFARGYRSFDEKIGQAGSYSSGWWAGLSTSWRVPVRWSIPLSVIGAADLGIPDQKIRGYVGLNATLKEGPK